MATRTSLRGVAALSSLAALMVGLVAPPHAGADGNEGPGDPAAMRAITAGAGQSCAIVGDGLVKCWGGAANGALGTGDQEPRGDAPGEMGDALPFVDLGTGRVATALSAGRGTTCSLLDGGDVKCWGLNAAGGLGQGDVEDRGDEPGELGDALPIVDLGTGHAATAITVGFLNSCALLDDGAVKCWGYGPLLGQGFDDTVNLGDEPGEMGDALPAVDLGTGRTATAITAAQDHVCAILDDGSVKCWGDNHTGELGLGDTEPRGDEPGEMGDALPTVDLGVGRTATAISAGWNHTCALLDDASVKCWGSNVFGYGDGETRGDGPGEMGDALPAIDLGDGRSVAAVSAGDFHACALLDDATVKCWGDGGQGQVGSGDATVRGDQPGEMGDDLPTVDLGAGRSATAITSGFTHTCARLDDGSIRCWGAGGVLGVGDEEYRGDEPGEMGDALPRVVLGAFRCVGRPFTAHLASGGTTTSGPDVVIGTPGPDAIDARGGDDVVCGRAGNDTVRGGGGLDRLYGGSGEDSVWAGPDGGLVAGNADDDTLHGGRGRDTLRGGAGDDQLTAGAGNDLGDGGDDVDRCAMAPGRDTKLRCEG